MRRKFWFIFVFLFIVLGTLPIHIEGETSKESRSIHYFILEETNQDKLPGPLGIHTYEFQKRPFELVDGSLVFNKEFVDALRSGQAAEQFGLSPASGQIPFDKIEGIIEHRIAYRGVGRNDMRTVFVLLPQAGGTIDKPDAPQESTLTLVADELLPALYGIRLWRSDLELHVEEEGKMAVIHYGEKEYSLPLKPKSSVTLGGGNRKISLNIIYLNPIPKGPPQQPTIGQQRSGPYGFSTNLSMTYLGKLAVSVKEGTAP